MGNRTRLIGGFVGVATLAMASMAMAASFFSGELLPVADGFHRQWATNSGSSTHFTHVDDAACNGTTDFVFTTTVGRKDSYAVSLAGIPNANTATNVVITRIDMVPCASRNSGGGGSPVMDLFYRWNGVDSSATGNYALVGTTPVQMATSTFSGLFLQKDATSTLESGALYSAGGNKGARLSRLATVLQYIVEAFPMAPPTNLVASATGGPLTVQLSWNDNSLIESGYSVERNSNGAGFVAIATKAANATTHVDVVSATGTHAYRVRGFNPNGNSAFSNTASVIFP